MSEPEIELVNAHAFARVAPGRGGLVTAFAIGNATQHEPVLFLDRASFEDRTKNVRGGIPLLFPFGGKLPGDAYEVTLRDGSTRSCAMKQHGFARGLPFEVLARSSSQVVMELRDNETTRTSYPFSFRFTVDVSLFGPTLVMHQTIENLSDMPMPIAPGIHPYFAIDDKALAQVDSQATLAFDNVTGKQGPVPGAIRFDAGDLDLHLLNHHEKHIVLSRGPAGSGGSGGGSRPMRPIEISWSWDGGAVVLWTLPGKQFVCVEPWVQPTGTFGTPRCPTLAPGESQKFSMRFGLV